MIWADLRALSDCTPQGRQLRTVGFRAIQARWHLPDDEHSVQAIRETLAAHGWTLRDDRIPLAPSERGAGIYPIHLQAEYLPPDPERLAERLEQPLGASSLTDWLWLIVPEAQRWKDRLDFSLEDALQEGFLSLRQSWAAATTHLDRPAKEWVDRARQTIRHGLGRAFIRQTRTIHLPRAMRDLLREIQTAHWTVAAAVGHEPTLAELAEYLFRPVEQIQEALLHEQEALSLDLPMNDDTSTTLVTQIPDPDPSPEAVALTAQDAAIDPECVPWLRVLWDRQWTLQQLADWTGWDPRAIATALDLRPDLAYSTYHPLQSA